MISTPRLLAIVGSGETTASAAPAHRAILGRLGGPPVPATLLDTPYGFQENAADITSAAVDYFERRLRNPISVASFRRADVDPLARASAEERIREARYVFSGPGSPSYALKQWAGTEIPGLLAEKLTNGGALVMASAAALTLGRLTVPVYEIYKVGDDAHWLAGLDLPAAFGWSVAIVPHYDNAEGGGHDTRFCFLGERRLRRLEDDMPDEAFVLGVDEHTTLILDIGERRATVRGRGGVTVRRRGQSTVFPSGSEVSFEEITAAAFGGTSATTSPVPPRRERASTGSAAPAAPGTTNADDRFGDAVGRGDIRTAIEALVGAADDASTPQGKARLRSMIVRLAAAAEPVTRRVALVEPLADALVDARDAARTRRDWPAADTIRERLLAAGVEIHDAPEGTTWSIVDNGTAGAAEALPGRGTVR
ncbi:MAG TPA: hypothetical protein VKA85_11425 [Candidatus Limnocylindrales bacterium]|nr:hypothetical protein [Candidatus Limnocylindrales bacterium]